MRSIDAVYGEALEDLSPVIADLKYQRCGADQVQISSHDLPESRVAPLVRAMMRAEAEILLDNAAPGYDTYYPSATDEQ